MCIKTRRSGVGLIPMLLIFGLSANAQAQPSPKVVEGVIVQVTKSEVVIDLGRDDGLVDGTTVRIYRRLEVKHPVTRKTIIDRFPTGILELSQVGTKLSISTNFQLLTKHPKPGDFAVYYPPKPKPEPTPTPKLEDPKPAPAIVEVAPEQRAIEEAFERTLGRPVDARIEVWETYLSTYPESPYLETVTKELTWLRTTLAKERKIIEGKTAIKRAGPLNASVSAPRTIVRGQPMEIVASIAQPTDVEAVRVLVRRVNETGFETLLMTRDGDVSWRLTVKESWLEGEKLDFFVEAVRVNGSLEALQGSSGSPRTLLIEEPASDPAPTFNRSRATATFEYVDFKSGTGDDSFLRFESDYRYTIDMRGLKAFKVGVGIFEGKGGTITEVEQNTSRRLNTSYGFAETEVELHDYIGMSSRVMLGNQSASDRDALSSSFGFRSELRLGEFDGTRLTLGVALSDGIGNEGWIALWIDAIERVPMSGEVVVTNLPVGEDLGVSLNYGIGYEVLEGFTPMLRVGWNARTINHTGFSAGLSTAYVW